MQNDDHVSKDVQTLVKNMGFQTEPIPKSPSVKTPDFRVKMCEGDMIVEVKSKEDDEQLRKLMKSPPDATLPYQPSTLIERLYKAWGQIDRFPDRKDEDFTLIWYVTRFPRGITILTGSVLEDLLYGKVKLEGE